MRRTIVEYVDWYLLGAVLLLCILGFFNLYSASSAFGSKILLKQQLIAFSIGLVFMAITLFVNYSFLGRLAYFIYGFSIILLIVVFLRGHAAQGAQRWLSLGFVRLQVSDIAKVAYVIVLARWYSNSKILDAYSLRNLTLPIALVMVPFVLILKQPDLGTAVILLFIAFSMFLFGGLKIKSIFVLMILVSILVPSTWIFVLKDYQKTRVISFIDPMSSPRGAGYNVIQSMIAVGSGKFWGKGYKMGTQTSLHFLPEHHTDFIFSAWAEEQGFFGAMILLFLYLLVFARIIRILGIAKDKLGIFLVLGGGSILFWYSFININMVIGMMPVVGVPLPFFSYGGTAMVVNFIILGIILNVNARRFVY